MAHLASLLDAVTGLEIVTPDTDDKRAGILTFRSDAMSGRELHRRLMDAGVICSSRAGGVRFSPHFYTPRDRLERAVDILCDVLRR